MAVLTDLLDDEQARSLLAPLHGLGAAACAAVHDTFLVKTAERHRGILVIFDPGATSHDPSGRRVLVLDA